MSMIDRYKKKGGFVQLLNLIETTGKEKQEKFLKMIAEENALWETEIRKKMLSLEKVLSWPSQYLAEILPRIQAIQLAMIVGGLPQDKADLLLNTMGFKEKRQISDLLKEKQPNPGETSAGVMKLFAEIRKMESEGLLKFDKIDPEMVIGENIEEHLEKGSGPSSPPSMTKITNVAVSVAPPPPGTPNDVAEELTGLRRKLVQLNQENQKLLQENMQMKEKLDKIKKIA